MADKHTGSCLCGAVTITVSGKPALMGYCHCDSCRSYSGGPVNTFTLWKPESVTVTKGADVLGRFQKTEKTIRRYCTKCGGHVMAEHPKIGLTDVFAGILPGLDFKPAIHVNYAEAVLRMKDGLPKFKDFPKDAGGSGETMAD